MGIFLILAVFFGNSQLISLLEPTSISGSVQVTCQNQSYGYNCTGNLSTTSEHSQSSPYDAYYPKLFSFFCLIFAFLIGILLLIDSISYVQLWEHSKTTNMLSAIVNTLKDCTILFFIGPFGFIILLFSLLILHYFSEFLSTGFLILISICYAAEILILLLVLIMGYNTVKENKIKRIFFAILTAICAIISYLIPMDSAFLPSKVLLIVLLLGFSALSLFKKGNAFEKK